MGVKSILQQGGDGTAIPENMVGAKVDSEAFIQTLFNTSDTDVQKSGGAAATLALTTGTWRIEYNLVCFYQTATTLNDQGKTTIRIRTTGGTEVAGTKKSVYSRTEVSGRAATTAVAVYGSAVVTVSSATSYKLTGKRIDTVGTGSGGTDNFVDSEAQFFAIRIG
jgi:hypothetical protein